MSESSIAVLIPCYNETLTIAKGIDDFAAQLPEASIYVYCYNSSDNTATVAQAHGAIVIREPRHGIGNVVRQMLRDIDADCYTMVDGDDTYPAELTRQLIDPVLAGEADHVVRDRLSNGTYGEENKRAGHAFGNDLVRWLISWLYGYKYNDVMTGYRAFSRPFPKTLPVLPPGFEVEMELSIHAVDKFWRVKQVPIEYRDRPEGSFSKLETIPDGLRVLCLIASLAKDYKPLPFYSLEAALFFAVGLAFGIPVIQGFTATGLVTKLPSALVAVSFCGLPALLLSCGIVLDTVVKCSRRQWEIETMCVYRNSNRVRES